MILVQKIQDIVDVKLADSANFIVDISVKPGNKITVLLDNNKGVSIVDCVEMSRHIESNLDREVEDFELSVMSPGLTEPFKILKQYQKNIEKQIEVLTKENNKITGKLLSANEEEIELAATISEKIEGKKKKQQTIKNIRLPFSQIKTTKLVLLF